MDKVKFPFCASAIIFLCYYILTPIFLFATGLPFVSAFFKTSSLAYLGLGILLFFKKPGILVGVFTLICGFLQVSPTIYFIGQLFKGDLNLSNAFGLLPSLLTAVSFGFLTYFSISLSLAEPKTNGIKRLWLVPTLCPLAGFLLCLADQLVLYITLGGAKLLPFILNLLLMLILAVAISLLGPWYKACAKRV